MTDDGLEQHHAVRFQQIAATLEVRVIERVPDRFDHFDRNELIVLPLEIAIILEQNSDAVAQTRRRDPSPGKLVLLLRDFRRRDSAAVSLCGMYGKRPPTGADLQQMIVG